MKAWTIPLPAGDIAEKIKAYARANGMYCAYSMGQIILRKPYLMANAIPINFQPSLILKVRKVSETESSMTGSTGFPKSSILCFALCFY